MTSEAWQGHPDNVTYLHEQLSSYEEVRLALMRSAAQAAGYFLLPGAASLHLDDLKWYLGAMKVDFKEEEALIDAVNTPGYDPTGEDAEQIGTFIGRLSQVMLERAPRNSVNIRTVGQTVLSESSTDLTHPLIQAVRSAEQATESLPSVRPNVLHDMQERLDPSILPKLEAYASFTQQGMDFTFDTTNNFDPSRIKRLMGKTVGKNVEYNGYTLTERDVLLLIAQRYQRKIKNFPASYEDGEYPKGLYDTARDVEFALLYMKSQVDDSSVKELASAYGVSLQVFCAPYQELARTIVRASERYESATGRPAFELIIPELSKPAELTVMSLANRVGAKVAETAVEVPVSIESAPKMSGRPPEDMFSIAGRYGLGLPASEIAAEYSKSQSHVTYCVKRVVNYLQENLDEDPELLMRLLERYRPKKRKARTGLSTVVSVASGEQKDKSEDLSETDGYRLYIRQLEGAPLLSHEEEVDLAKRIEVGLFAEKRLKEDSEEGMLDAGHREELQWLVSDGKAARDHLVEANLRLVIKYASRAKDIQLPFLDLIQEGNLAIIHAVRKFDYAKGYKFSTYAESWIRKYLSDAVRDQGKSVRLSKGMSELVTRVKRANRTLANELAREPTVEEVAGMLGMKVEEVLKAERYSRGAVYLNTQLAGGETELGEIVLRSKDDTAVLGTEFDKWQRVGTIMSAVLNNDEAAVFYRRYGLFGANPMSAEQIGEELQMTVRNVRYKIETALQKIRTSVYADELFELLR